MDTRVSPTIHSGQRLRVECVVLGEYGAPIHPDFAPKTLVEVSPKDFVATEMTGVDGANEVYRAIRVGNLSVRCIVPSARLADRSPAVVEVKAGTPIKVVAVPPAAPVTAGEAVEVGCQAYDAYDNPVEQETATVRFSPNERTTKVKGRLATVTQAGSYEAACDLQGAQSLAATFKVNPGTPSKVRLSRTPNVPSYDIGESILVEGIVTDAYGNPIPELAVDVSVEDGEMTRPGLLRFEKEGVFRVVGTAVVDDETALTGHLDIEVNARGPAIRCGTAGDGPTHAGTLDITPGTEIPFHGQAVDMHDVETVTVNGKEAWLESDGSFLSALPVQFGTNFVEVVATDKHGVSNTRVCAFLASDHWLAEDEFLPDAVAMSLAQRALDDSLRNESLDSVADLLHEVLNAQELVKLLQGPLAANPKLKDGGCDVRIGLCLFSIDATYQGLSLGGPNQVSLTAIEGGFRAIVTLRDFDFTVKVSPNGKQGSWFPTQTPTAEVETIVIELDLGLGQAAGKPQITVRDAFVRIPSLNVDFSGFAAKLKEAVANLFEGTIRKQIEQAASKALADSLAPALDTALAGIDLDTMVPAVEVPTLDQHSTIPLRAGLNFSRLETAAGRTRVGIATRFSVPSSGIDYATVGIPVQRGGWLEDKGFRLGTDQPIEVGVHLGLLNQGLHALWRAGLLELNLDSAALLETGLDLPELPLPGDFGIQLSAGLPPVAVLREDGRIEVGLGALHLGLTLPDLLDRPLEIGLGARLLIDVALEDNVLQIRSLAVDQLFLSSSAAPLEPWVQQVIRDTLLPMAQGFIDKELTDKLPEITLPSLDLPQELANLGFEPNTKLGLRSPELLASTPYMTLEGAFGAFVPPAPREEPSHPPTRP